MASEWITQPVPPDYRALAGRLAVAPLLAKLLINRGLSDDDACAAFLSPAMQDLCPPDTLPDARRAADIVVDAIRTGKRIMLYGDYDVDGTTGVAILWHALKAADADVGYYVPHRVTEGYGLNTDAVRRLANDGAELIVTIDCGITACDVAAEVRRLGVKLIITDHHTRDTSLPWADAIVHPALESTYENPHLCGAGVAFKLAWAIGQSLSGEDRVDPAFRTLLLELLPLAALGTIADVVPLVGENRTIAKHGLARLAHSKLAGVRALIDSAGLTNKPVSAHEVGFKLAPRINAAGRMGHAELAVELLTTSAQDRAREIAIYLEEHNRSRQATERKITKQAIVMVERDNLAGDHRRAIVVAGEDWHPGVIGIVAARLVDRYHRPSVVISLSDGEGQGSARSISNFDLSRALSRCREDLTSHGGHAMAAGLRITRDRVESFRDRFVELANTQLTGYDLKPKLHLDADVELKELSLETAQAIDALGPFGTGNPKPRLATDWLDLVAEPRCVGKSGQHLQATFSQGATRIKGIGFSLAAAAENLKHHRRCRVAFQPIINEFNGRRTVEMQMLDLKFPA